MNQRLYPILKNLRIILITAIVIVLAFGVTDIVKKQTNTIEVVAMIVLLFCLVYLLLIGPSSTQSSTISSTQNETENKQTE